MKEIREYFNLDNFLLLTFSIFMMSFFLVPTHETFLNYVINHYEKIHYDYEIISIMLWCPSLIVNNWWLVFAHKTYSK